MKRIAFFLLYLLILLLGIITFIEKSRGTPFVLEHFYGSWWFALLWGILALTGMLCFFRHKRHRMYSLSLHLSLVIILLGALLTSLTARRGIVHLREGVPVSNYLEEAGSGQRVRPLPFTLTLDRFQVTYHSGTNAPADYRSHFTLNDTQRQTTVQGMVAMNQIYTYRNIRFYQSSYDSDERGSYLTLNKDPWGVTVTYLGYFLLFASLLGMLADPKGSFRKLLRHPVLRKGAFLLFAAAFPCLVNAQEEKPRTLTEEQARQLGELLIEYNGRVCPLQTFAIDFTKKLSGKRSFKHYSAEQVLTGFIFYTRDWDHVPLIHVKSRALRKATGLKEWASVDDFFSSSQGYLLGDLIGNYDPRKNTPEEKAATDMDDRLQLIMSLRRKECLRMFPATDTKGNVRWYSPVDPLPLETESGQALFVNQAFNLIYLLGIVPGQEDGFKEIVGKVDRYQQKYGDHSLPSEHRLKAERLYNHIPFSDLLYKINLTVGLVLLILHLIRLLHKTTPTERKGRYLQHAAAGVLLLSFLALTACLMLRGIISQRIPMGNGYETMLVLAWCVQLITLLVIKRLPFLLSFGFLLAGFFLLVSSIGQMDPQITPLVPVLSSPLLSLHVSLIMMAYALFAFTFLCGIVALTLQFFRPNQPLHAEHIQALHVISRLFLYPALALLGIGIFVGAIWANISWGRYWGWDPKEVWALISFLCYAVALHGTSLPWFRRPLNYHLYMTGAFLTVLMTYIGVNYFLGGMHSYA